MAEQPSEELITITWQRAVPYKWKLGRVLGRFYKEMRDNKRLVGNQCPKCKELMFPPRTVCGRCKVRAGEELEEISQKGTVRLYNPMVQKFWNPRTGDWYEDPHPSATILLDGDVFTSHALEETDIEKLRVGMRVEAVWKEKKERGEGMGDILYFRTIEE